MERLIAWTSRFARCTVVAGLKVEQAAIARLATVWPELATTAGVAEAEGVYPRVFWDFLHHSWQQRNPGYPPFHTNSCALAYVRPRGRDEPSAGTMLRLDPKVPAPA